MKVRFKYKTTFGDLEVGDTFLIHGEEDIRVYMKVPPHTAEDGPNVVRNLVQLTGACVGRTFRLNDHSIVIPRKFELVELEETIND